MAYEVQLHYMAFPTDFGWMAALGGGATLRQLVFGYRSKAVAIAALNPKISAAARPGDWCAELSQRLEDYAAGGSADFRDVQVDLTHLTPFQCRVVKHCREIPFGGTCSYGELARVSGSRGAARAVGSTMACNRYPLVVPCHRVINSDGSIGHFSSPDGPHMKLRLLELEQRSLAQHGGEPRAYRLSRRSPSRC